MLILQLPNIQPQCYFLLSASPSTPIIYSVEPIRSGKSYATRSVKAIQKGQIIFMMLCSFQKPEPWQPAHHWPMPLGVKSPEECELQEIVLRRAAESAADEFMRDWFLDFARVSVLIEGRWGWALMSVGIRSDQGVLLR